MKVLQFFLVVLLACGCGKEPTPKGKPLVLVSVAPYQFFAERIGGGAIEVQSIVPSQADPHVFEPTMRQMKEASRAVVWFRMGEPFEEKLVSAVSPTTFVSDLRISSDRHPWVSPRLALQQAETMAEVLQEKFPEHREVFQHNVSKLREELVALDRDIREMLEPVQNRVLLVSHPAFHAFCCDYGIEQISLEEEGKEARPKQIESSIARARAHGARFALALPQHNSKGAERVAARLHIPIIVLDPYSEDYLHMMRAVAAHLAGHP